MDEDRFSQCRDALASEGLLPATELTTMIVGSTAQGWSHQYSDLDFAIVSTESLVHEELLTADVPLAPGHLSVTALRHEGNRWEVKYWLDSQVDELMDKISWKAFEEQKAGPPLVEVEQLFLDRLLSCIPLSGDEWVATRREQIKTSALRAFLVRYNLAKSDSFANAALGQLAVSDTESGVLSMKAAFDYLVDALLASHDQYGSLVKWRARRYRAADPEALPFDQYWAIETMRDLDPANPGEWIKKVYELCKDLTAEIEVG
ncbi:hypothetical protein [Streptosporangium sp. NPDC049376]|uniref:hypothetical protein n=1 Tax=Streptosporangium sp. NPDC049376 TaxID=3366192 RepID=UPI00379E9786